ncbi:hypothetical protein LHP98_13155 [Rhodobacter sp. Har01]|uniref:hypothetical protein n=1 Tax=Rhodobacter sp. Har01 TaxID=2883999 RepID=UPI001D08B898|nr:hypothetical protein [Rhodobacter sp. Har01]MCB6179067.1 hypothetical protein [Rhodobacter sp. Har01]
MASLAWVAVLAALLSAGALLLLAAATLALAQEIGPILALAAVGASLIAAAGLVALLWHRRAGPAFEPVFPPGPPLRRDVLAQLAFVLGFTLARRLMRRFGGEDPR